MLDLLRNEALVGAQGPTHPLTRDATAVRSEARTATSVLAEPALHSCYGDWEGISRKVEELVQGHVTDGRATKRAPSS